MQTSTAQRCKYMAESDGISRSTIWSVGGFLRVQMRGWAMAFYECKCVGERRLFQVYFRRYDFVTCMYRLCYQSERIIDVFELRNVYIRCERIALRVFVK